MYKIIYLFLVFALCKTTPDLYLDNQQINQMAEDIAENSEFQLNTCLEKEQVSYLEFKQSSDFSVIIVCNIHAREAITAEICLDWAHKFSKNARNRIKNAHIILFYLSNTNRQAIFEGDTEARKSESGVDLNRNFPTQFNAYKKKKQSLIYSGPYPFSEPFNQCLQRLVEEELPTLFLDIHTGQNGAIFYQESSHNEQEMEVINNINQQICQNSCRITTLYKDGESINGHIFADLKVRMKVKYSILFQTYGKQDSDIFQYFNPSTEDQKNQLIDKWSHAIQFTIDQVYDQEFSKND